MRVCKEKGATGTIAAKTNWSVKTAYATTNATKALEERKVKHQERFDPALWRSRSSISRKLRKEMILKYGIRREQSSVYLHVNLAPTALL